MSAATHPITELGLCLKSVECDTEIHGVLAWSLESLLGEVFLEAQRMKECPAHSRGDSSSWTSLFILFGTLCVAPAGRAKAHWGSDISRVPLAAGGALGLGPHAGLGFVQDLPFVQLSCHRKKPSLAFPGSLQLLALTTPFWSDAPGMQCYLGVLLKLDTKLRLY